MNPLPPRPDWLYRMTYGLADGNKTRVLHEGTRFAIVQIPGGRFMNGQESQYGGTTFYLVDKEKADYRRGVGLIDSHVLQDGGRAKLAQWRPLVEASDKAGKLVTCAVCGDTKIAMERDRGAVPCPYCTQETKNESDAS